MVRSYNGNKAFSVLAPILLFVREIDMRFYIERNAIIASVFSHLLMKSRLTLFIEVLNIPFIVCYTYSTTGWL